MSTQSLRSQVISVNLSCKFVNHLISLYGRTPTTRSNEAPQCHVGGRVPGAKQYHKPTGYDLIDQYRPISSVMWDLVAAQ